MPELLHFHVDGDSDIVVEVDVDDSNFRPAAPDGSIWANERFGEAMNRARRAAEVAFAQFINMDVKPAEIEMQFGIKLSGEAGAIIAKTTSEANISIKLVWRAAA